MTKHKKQKLNPHFGIYKDNSANDETSCVQSNANINEEKVSQPRHDMAEVTNEEERTMATASAIGSFAEKLKNG